MAAGGGGEMIEMVHGRKEAQVDDLRAQIEEARGLAASHDEAKALKLLHYALDHTNDPALVAEIHELATSAHEASRGFHKIEWNRLMIESEHRAAAGNTA